MSELAPRLLVIGHDPDSGALGEALEASEFDHEVVTVADRGAASGILRRERIDCVVSAYEIPDEAGRTYMGGLRLLETVREEHDDLPFVLFTDVVNEDSIRLAAANGVRAYVRDQAGENAVGQLRYHVDSAVRGRLAERRAAEQDRINELMRGVTQTLVLEEDRGPMLSALCAKLTEQDVYRFAAYHERSGDAGARGSVDEAPEADAGTSTGNPGSTSLLRRCLERGEVETAQLRRSVDGSASAQGEDGGWETVLRIAVPIGYEDERFGVLVLETDPEHAFFESETAVLAELGEAIGHALNAVETREALRRREAELEHRTEQLEGFASLVSHDVRNPLNVAQGYVDLLAERVDDDAVEEIAESLDRIEAIVADILALTRAEGELDLAPADLDAVVEDAWASVDTADATLDAGDLPRVEADRSQLQRVFENLFRNAVEHGSASPRSPEAHEDAVEHGSTSPGSQARQDPIEHGSPEDGGLTVTVAFDSDWAGDGGAAGAGEDANGAETGTLRVEDDGVGFPDGATEGLFDLGETGSSGGTGIGLAIVGDLLDQHGWTVTAENRESGGARFRIGGVEPLG